MDDNRSTGHGQDALRRQMDDFYLARFGEMSAAISRLQAAFEASLKAGTEIQGNQARMIERIAAFNEKFIEHDEREGADRERIIATLQQVVAAIGTHERHLERHAEALATLKQWSMLLAAALGALAAGGTGWIIQHLQATVR